MGCHISLAVSKGLTDIQITKATRKDVMPKKKGNHNVVEASDDEGIMNKATDDDAATKSATSTTDNQGVMAKTIEVAGVLQRVSKRLRLAKAPQPKIVAAALQRAP